MKAFEVKVPLFEGPFDLLLFFIKRDEIDIHDIPIAKVTHDFLDYIRQLEALNMEVASEFIVVAATLMRIKAKMLLPRKEKDEEGNEIDPREDLVKHLLEYKKYKSVINDFEELENGMRQREKRGNVQKEVKKLSQLNSLEAELQHIDLYKLLKTFNRVMARHEAEQNRPTHRVVPYPYKLEEQKDFILAKVTAQKRPVAFSELMSEHPDKIAVIFNFMAILELLAASEIGLSLGEGFNNFWITPKQAEVPERY